MNINLNRSIKFVGSIARRIFNGIWSLLFKLFISTSYNASTTAHYDGSPNDSIHDTIWISEFTKCIFQLDQTDLQWLEIFTNFPVQTPTGIIINNLVWFFCSLYLRKKQLDNNEIIDSDAQFSFLIFIRQ